VVDLGGILWRLHVLLLLLLHRAILEIGVGGLQSGWSWWEGMEMLLDLCALD
jgi:hypothetical protein